MDVSQNAHNHDDFLEQFPLGSFLQSRFWKHFLTLQGKKTWQLGVYDNENRLIAHCVLYATNLIFGKSYLYAPKGPFILPTLSIEDRKEAFELILGQIRDITIATRKQEEIFCRLEPNIAPPMLSQIPVVKVDPIQPTTTMYRNLEMSEDALLASFKEKTRYNIRLAQKKNVTVEWSHDAKGMKIFLSLLSKTAGRQKIRLHDRKHYELLLKAGTDFNAVHINYALYENKPIAANIYIAQYPTMTYIHGGFNYKYRALMAPYLLQWDAIRFAKARRLDYYDFWGYQPRDGSKPSWAGFTRFKDGFNGTIVENPGCYDFIYNPLWYHGYERMKRMRKKLKL